MICYQSMYLELFMDIGKSDMSAEDIRKALPEAMSKLNGIYDLMEFTEISRQQDRKS